MAKQDKFSSTLNQCSGLRAIQTFVQNQGVFSEEQVNQVMGRAEDFINNNLANIIPLVQSFSHKYYLTAIRYFVDNNAVTSATIGLGLVELINEASGGRGSEELIKQIRLIVYKMEPKADSSAEELAAMARLLPEAGDPGSETYTLVVGARSDKIAGFATELSIDEALHVVRALGNYKASNTILLALVEKMTTEDQALAILTETNFLSVGGRAVLNAAIPKLIEICKKGESNVAALLYRTGVFAPPVTRLIIHFNSASRFFDHAESILQQLQG